MQNPIMQALNQNAGQVNNPFELMRQFQEFKKNMAGKNPQAMVQELLNSGQMSQTQFEELQKQAQSLQGILK